MHTSIDDISGKRRKVLACLCYYVTVLSGPGYTCCVHADTEGLPGTVEGVEVGGKHST